MQRDGIVDPRANPRRFQMMLQLLAVGDPNHKQVVHRFRPTRLERQRDTIALPQQLAVAFPILPPLFIPFREVLQFHAQKTGLHRVQPAVVTLDIVVILLGLSVIAQHPASPVDFGIVGGDGSRLAARAQILPRIKAERGRVADRASFFPAIVLAREILRAVRLARVFDQNQIILLDQSANGIHIRHLSVKMNRDHRFDRLAALPVNQNSIARLAFCF